VNILETYNSEFYHKVFVTWWGRSDLKFGASDIYFSDEPNYFQMHEIEQNMILIRKQGFKELTPKQYVNFKQLPKGKRIIGLHSGCFGGVWEKKKYPYFKELAERLLGINFQVFNFGGLNEKLDIEHKNFQDFAGYQNLQESINLMSRCNYFIANDSGLMHIADAIRIPLIALFGSTLVTKNRPVSKDTHVMVSENGLFGRCVPCQYTDAFNQCTDNQCMKNIAVDDILNFVNDLGWTKNT
jgi:ADP-heptose:LPS heptosyltransferase